MGLPQTWSDNRNGAEVLPEEKGRIWHNLAVYSSPVNSWSQQCLSNKCLGRTCSCSLGESQADNRDSHPDSQKEVNVSKNVSMCRKHWGRWKQPKEALKLLICKQGKKLLNVTIFTPREEKQIWDLNVTFAHRVCAFISEKPLDNISQQNIIWVTPSWQRWRLLNGSPTVLTL